MGSIHERVSRGHGADVMSSAGDVLSSEYDVLSSAEDNISSAYRILFSTQM